MPDWNGYQWVAFWVPVIGLIIGGLTLLRTYVRDSVRLKVRIGTIAPFPRANLPDPFSDKGIYVEVINRGSFAVTIGEVGVLMGRLGLRSKRRFPLANDDFEFSEAIPHRLEAHSKLKVRFAAETLVDFLDGNEIVAAYAETDSLHTFYGGRGAFDGRPLDRIRRLMAYHAHNKSIVPPSWTE